MALAIAVVALLAYAVALVASYRRWRWFGPVGVGLIVVLGYLAWGTLDWQRPHTDPIQLSRFVDWQCHSVDAIPSLALLTIAGIVALRIVSHPEPKWRTQLTAVGISFGLAFLPAALLMLFMGVGLLPCDTL